MSLEGKSWAEVVKKANEQYFVASLVLRIAVLIFLMWLALEYSG